MRKFICVLRKNCAPCRVEAQEFKFTFLKSFFLSLSNIMFREKINKIKFRIRLSFPCVCPFVKSLFSHLLI